MANKKFKKIIFMVLLATNSLFLPSIAQADLTCASLNQPEDTKGYIVVILEESIGKTTTTTADITTILDCFRETVCTEEETEEETEEDLEKEFEEDTSEAKTICKSTYVGQGECSVSQGITCQRIQAYIASSGAGLLFTYISQIYRWAAIVIGSVSVLFMVVGGVQIATAGDNSERLNQAKERIMQSIAGLVLLFMSAVILYSINPNFFTIT